MKTRLPEILSSGQGVRTIALDLAAGEKLSEHEVHEGAWVVVIEGEVEMTTPSAERAAGGAGLLVQFSPGERHEVAAVSEARLLLFLAPWPGEGHPGAMSMREKLYARRHAAKRRNP